MIPYFDYRPEYERLKPDIDAAWSRVLGSGLLVLGPEVAAFEREVAAAVGARGGVGVASGTDALILGLRALGIGAGDEVLTVANAGVPPVAAIRAVGATPRFVDVRPDTLLIDPQRARDALTPRTRCVLVVHLYGQPAELDAILAFAGSHGLAVVEDCAQAQGATYGGRAVGGFGAVGCFSFYPTKIVGAFGDGGLCVTSAAEVEERLRCLRMYGFRGDRHAHLEGVNSRLDELQAAILRVKLRHLSDTVEQRRRIARRYREGLADCACRMVGETPGAEGVHHLFVVRVAERAAVIAALEREGVGHGVHYPEPVHLMEAYRFLGHEPGDLPVTERACEEVLSLPIYPGLSESAIEQVVRAVRHACR